MAFSGARFTSYCEFWAFYVGEHRRPGTRWLHFAGTTLGLLLIGAAILTSDPWLLPGVPVAAYGPAWLGHFLVEGNFPATFHNPIYSLRADFHMYLLMWAGRMQAEVRKHSPGAGPSPVASRPNR